MESIQGIWESRSNSVPVTGEQRTDAFIYKTISKGIFDDYGLYTVLDGLVKLYPQYNHDDIFRKPVSEVIALDDLNRRNQYIQAKMNEERRKEDKK